MKNVPTEPDVASPEDVDAYARWVRAEVQASIDDPRPSLPHDQVMARMHAFLAEKNMKRS